ANDQDYCQDNKCPAAGGEVLEGRDCIVVNGAGDIARGKWDADDYYCLKCNSPSDSVICGSSAGITVAGPELCDGGGVRNCEQACGADSDCDEINPNSCGLNKKWCDSNCRAMTYDGDIASIFCECATGSTGNWHDNKCCGDDGAEDFYVGDTGACCEGKWVSGGECCKDADCGFDSTTKLKMECITYDCRTGVCSSNSDCDNGYCCEAVVGGSNRICREKEYIYNNKYLCDPGEWVECGSDNVNLIQTFDEKSYKCVLENGEYKWVKSSEIKPAMNIFEVIINFLRSLFNF
ncbi:MAG: hypothetical protein ACE5J9_08220, partial [Methanosarcinales archaeon]